MKDITAVRQEWQNVYEAVKVFIDGLETSYQERERSISIKLAEVKLIDEKAKLLLAEKQQIALDREMLEKQQKALRDKQTSLDHYDKKLQEKATRLQSLLSE